MAIVTDLLKAPDKQRQAERDRLVSVIGAADFETLLELHRFLLNAMFPSMPESARQVLLPLFEMVTPEAQSD